jgi:hypothetical protein
MRRLLPFLLLFSALLVSILLHAQDGTQPPDDMPFILVLAIVLLSVAAGAMIVGALAAILALCIVFMMTSAGILSTAIIVGLYKRSVTAGFKTLFILTSSACGIMKGIGGIYLINHLFQLHLSRIAIVLSGFAGGLAGGVLLALAIIGIIRVMIGYFKNRLAL